MGQIHFIKLIRALVISVIVFVAFSCKKETYTYVEEFDFTFTDEYAGQYQGEIITNTGRTGMPPFQVDTIDSVIFNVEDFRTPTICKFYVDYIDDTVYVLSSGDAITFWSHEYGETNYNLLNFRTDSLILIEHIEYLPNPYNAFEFRGVKL